MSLLATRASRLAPRQPWPGGRAAANKNGQCYNRAKYPFPEHTKCHLNVRHHVSCNLGTHVPFLVVSHPATPWSPATSEQGEDAGIHYFMTRGEKGRPSLISLRASN